MSDEIFQVTIDNSMAIDTVPRLMYTYELLFPFRVDGRTDQLDQNLFFL